MQASRVNTTIQEDGTLTVSHLPLQSRRSRGSDPGSIIDCAASGPLPPARHTHDLYRSGRTKRQTV
jgi:hypothetical protein